MTIGIDFGTTKTIVSWVNPRTGHAETIGCFSHSAQTPTQVFVGEDGECVYGERARIEGVIDPMGLWEKFKLKLGSSDLLVYRGSGRDGVQGMDAVDLAAKFLEYVKSTCESADEFRGCVIDSAVITVPVVFTHAQRSDLMKAATLAGFNKVTIKLEPEAAAVAYMKECPGLWKHALIVDWGGGTLDMALIEVDGHGNFVCNREYSRGRADIGGEEIDRKFVNYVINRFRERGATIPDLDSVDDDGGRDSAERRALLATEYYRIRNGILEDKTNLDSRASFSFYPKGGYGNSPRHSVSITQDDFRNQARDELDAACELLNELLNDIPVEKKPERLFLAGGTCWSDVIMDALQEASGLEVIRGLRAREMVALGAAYFIDDNNLRVARSRLIFHLKEFCDKKRWKGPEDNSVCVKAVRKRQKKQLQDHSPKTFEGGVEDRFHLVIEGVHGVKEHGFVVIGKVAGSKVRVGQIVDVKLYNKWYCAGEITGIERNQESIEVGSIGDRVSLQFKPNETLGVVLCPGAVLRAQRFDEEISTLSVAMGPMLTFGGTLVLTKKMLYFESAGRVVESLKLSVIESVFVRDGFLMTSIYISEKSGKSHEYMVVVKYCAYRREAEKFVSLVRKWCNKCQKTVR